MVIINPNPLNPGTGDPNVWYPPYDPYPSFTGTYTIEKEVEKKWREKHIKDVKKGILITFDDDEQPLFIATDDACWDKIMEAIKNERSTNNKRD